MHTGRQALPLAAAAWMLLHGAIAAPKPGGLGHLPPPEALRSAGLASAALSSSLAAIMESGIPPATHTVTVSFGGTATESLPTPAPPG
ncbi:hypothetical protein KXW46_001819, partial [Aspergillus fumigatus]